MNRVIYFSLFIFLILSSCSEATRDVVIDPELQPYVDRFLAEAAKRGHDIDLTESGLDVIFEVDISTAEYAGICRYNLGANEIAIDKERWDESTESRKEWLMYHELGHCVLDRRHRNDQFENGMWKSMMRGDLSQEEARIPLCYIWDREQYFIDELFDEDTSVPDWVTNSNTFENGPDRGAEILTVEPESANFNKFLNSPVENFEIELQYTRTREGAITQLIYSGNGSLEFNRVIIDHDNEEVIMGSDVMSCIRVPFNNESWNKLTIRQFEGTASVFVNDEFLHSFPAYKDPVTRIRNWGSQFMVIQSFKMWSL